MSRMALNIAHFKQGAVGSIGGHNWFRRGPKDQHSNQDIDPTRSEKNIALVLPEQGLYRAVKNDVENATGRVTAHSVWLSEWVLYPPEQLQDPATANPEELRRYYSDALEWMQANGYQVKLAVVHMDETTVHAHIDTVPITSDGRLSRKDVYTRAALNNIHTDLARHLAERGWDIQRGESTKDKQVRAKSIPEYKKDAEQTKLDLIQEIDRIERAVAGQREVEEIDGRSRTGITGSVVLKKEDYDLLKKQAYNAASMDMENVALRNQLKEKDREIERLKGTIKWLETKAKQHADELNKHTLRINELEEEISKHEGLLARIGSWITGKGKEWKDELDRLYAEHEAEWEAWHRAGNEMQRADNAIRKKQSQLRER